MLVHLQKTGGWSVVDAARAANVRCPDVIANAKVEKRRAWFNATYLKAEHRDGCAGYRASTPQDEGLLRSSILGQQAVLAQVPALRPVSTGSPCYLSFAC